jgi:EcoRII C terminal./Restriction endonuclease EcoRII, N-terminal.
MSRDIREWISATTGEGWFWYVKRLSGNDTLLNKSHQFGPYFPKNVIFRLFPSLKPTDFNPRVAFPATIVSHGVTATPQAIWYNSKRHGTGTRNECRLTNWGGSSSPLLDPDSTGSIAVFAFFKESDEKDAEQCLIWLCDSLEEEDAVEDRIGPVEPGAMIFYNTTGDAQYPLEFEERDSPCDLRPADVPEDWRFNFPDGQSIVDFVAARLPKARKEKVDRRLLRRRDCEYAVFRSVEILLAMPRIAEGFATVDLFVDFANSITNRRKSRAGKSLELQAKLIFDEEHLSYSHNKVSEGAKRPDFIFPSVAAYGDPNVPVEKLRMLAAKTTCKDRWRQVINEASRLQTKHLLTLQQGISPTQFAEMQAEGVVLVVPYDLHSTYDDSVKPHLVSLERFIGETSSLNS